MFQFAVSVPEGQHHGFQFLFECAYFSIECVKFSFSLGALAYFEAVDLFGEHEDTILCEIFC